MGTPSTTLDPRRAAPLAPSRPSRPERAPAAPTVASPPPPRDIAEAFATGRLARLAVLTTPAPSWPGWLPASARAELERPASPGVHVGAHTSEGRLVLVHRDVGADGVERQQVWRALPESHAHWTARAGGDAAAGRLLRDAAITWNRDVSALVRAGRAPGEAESEVRRLHGALLRGVIAAAADVFSSPATLPRVALAAVTRTRPSLATAPFPADARAEGPGTFFRKNVDGPRTPAAALALAERHGVRFPGSVEVRFLDADGARRLIPADAHATYGRVRPHAHVGWEDLHSARTGTLPVLVRPEVLESDEAIVAVLAHEAHELAALERLFERRGRVPGLELGRMLNDRASGGVPGNLHEQAWDAANALLGSLRGAGDD